MFCWLRKNVYLCSVIYADILKRILLKILIINT